MRLAHVLRRCAAIELSAARTYQSFAERWRSDPRIASLWERMAAAERTHAEVLEQAAELATAVNPVEPVDPSALARLSGHVAALTEPVPPPRDLVAALEIATDLEGLELEDLHRELIARIIPPVEEAVVTERLASGKDHLAPLLDLAEHCDAPEPLRRRLNALSADRGASGELSLPAVLSAILARIQRMLVPE
jgi:Rubrerythrin